MDVTVKIVDEERIAVSTLSKVTTIHWFPDTGELGLYCEEGSWIAAGTGVRGLHVMQKD